MSAQNKKQCERDALKLLAIRMYSEREMRKRLTFKGYDSETVDQVVANLCRYGYMNDTALCAALFRKYEESGKYGLNIIIARLKQRELPISLINDTVKEYDRTRAYEQAAELVRRRFKQPTAADSPRIGRFLAARGFTTSVIITVLEQLSESSTD